MVALSGSILCRSAWRACSGWCQSWALQAGIPLPRWLRAAAAGSRPASSQGSAGRGSCARQCAVKAFVTVPLPARAMVFLFICPREKTITEYFFLLKRRLKPLPLSIYKKTIKYVGYYIAKFWWKLKKIKFFISFIISITQTSELEPYCEMYRHIKWVVGEGDGNCPPLLEAIIRKN